MHRISVILFFILFFLPALQAEKSNKNKLKSVALFSINLGSFFKQRIASLKKGRLGLMQKLQLNLLQEALRLVKKSDKIPAWVYGQKSHEELKENWITFLKAWIPEKLTLRFSSNGNKGFFQGIFQASPENITNFHTVFLGLQGSGSRSIEINGKDATQITFPGKGKLFISQPETDAIMFSDRASFKGLQKLLKKSKDKKKGPLVSFTVYVNNLKKMGRIPSGAKLQKGPIKFPLEKVISLSYSLSWKSFRLIIKTKEPEEFNTTYVNFKSLVAGFKQQIEAILPRLPREKKAQAVAAYKTFYPEIVTYFNNLKTKIKKGKLFMLSGKTPRSLVSADPSAAPMLVAGVGILAAIAIPNFRKARGQAKMKSCAANMRVLMGAVEMFNMDNKPMMKSLDIARLQEEKYIRSRPTCSDGGVYSGEGLDGEGTVKCSVHGTINSLKMAPSTGGRR
ncbi:type IV pilin protein [Candidatus Riflebacteria bacterium]